MSLSGVLVDANFDIFIACFDKKRIELLIPQDVAYPMSVLRVAGPGMPACISSLLLSKFNLFSQFLREDTSKKNWVAKYNFKSVLRAKAFFSIIALSIFSFEISGFPSGCPAKPTYLKLNFYKSSVFNTSILEEIFPFCFPPPPMTKIFLQPALSDSDPIKSSKFEKSFIVLAGR